jgi:hypothetical protein
MLEGILSKWDAENETQVEETARRMAAIAFRQELQALFGARSTRPTPGKQAAWRMAATPSKELLHLSKDPPTDTTEPTSEARDSLPEAGLVTREFRRLEVAKEFRSLAAAELTDSTPGDKKVRRRRYRPAPRASKSKRDMVAKALESWLPQAAKEASEVDQVYTTVSQELREQLEKISKEQAADQELLNQLENVSAEQEEDVIPEADKKLAILQGIWDKYEFENNGAAVSAEDLAESLHLIQDPGGWYSEALRTLHQIGQSEPETPQIARMRGTVEALESELEEVETELREEGVEANGDAKARRHQRRAALRRRATEAVAALVRAKIDAHVERTARLH